MAKRSRSATLPPLPPQPVRPIDIPLPEGKMLYGGAVYKRFPTLFALEEFWAANRDTYPFAIEGIGLKDCVDQHGNPQQEHYLVTGEWIFSTSREAAIKALTRWDETGLRCELYDCPTADPEGWRFDLACGCDPSTGKWWRIANVYIGDPWTGNHEADNLPLELSIEAATTHLLDQLFDCLQKHRGDYDSFLYGELCLDRAGVDESIEDWREDATKKALKAADQAAAAGSNRFTTWLASYTIYGSVAGKNEFLHSEIMAAWLDYCDTFGLDPDAAMEKGTGG